MVAAIPAPPSPNDRFVPMDEVAARLSISKGHAYQLVRTGEIPGGVRIGTAVRVSLSELDAYIARLLAKGMGSDDLSRDV